MVSNLHNSRQSQVQITCMHSHRKSHATHAPKGVLTYSPYEKQKALWLTSTLHAYKCDEQPWKAQVRAIQLAGNTVGARYLGVHEDSWEQLGKARDSRGSVGVQQAVDGYTHGAAVHVQIDPAHPCEMSMYVCMC